MNPMIAILGAGRSRRFGSDKLTRPCAGKPLGRWALDAALATGRSVVWIAGEAPPRFVEARCNVLRNISAERGLWTSMACAADFAERCGHNAVLVMLADMPLVGAQLLARLLHGDALAACRHRDGRPGLPAVFPQSAFDELQQLSEERDVEALLAELAGLHLVDCDADDLLDVDQPGDLAEAARLLDRAAR